MFAEVYLDQDLWGLQQDLLRTVSRGGRTACKACHSSGKTYTAALAALHWLAKYDDGVVVTTAPTDIQVRTLLWGEINNAVLGSRYPFPKPNQTSMAINPKRYALGFSTNVNQQSEGVRFQGFHSGHILVILDEAPGVHPKIWDAIEGIRAGGLVSVLALGNPTINSGPFFDAFEKNRVGWNTYTISAFDTPNLKGLSIADLIRFERESPDELDRNERPYLTTRRWVLERFYEWGEDHPLYQSRVLGLFPTQSESSLISLAWLEVGKNREQVKKKGEIWGGLDVAGPGDDETSLTLREDGHVFLHKQWTKEDPRGEVVAELTPYKDRLRALNVDCIGIGWGMYLHLKDIFGGKVIPCNVATATEDSEKFENLKAELYWGLRERMKAGDFSGITDEKTIGQLAGIRYMSTPRGRTKIESKEDARKRGVKSPDRAESIMLCFAKPLKAGHVLMEWMEQQIAAQRG